MTVRPPRQTRPTPRPIDIHLGARLRAGRKAVGHTQKDLSELLDLTFQQIQKYEHGHNRMSAATLYCVSKVLDLPLDYFFHGFIDQERPHCGDRASLRGDNWPHLLEALQGAKDREAITDVMALIKRSSVRRRLSAIVAELACDG